MGPDRITMARRSSNDTPDPDTLDDQAPPEPAAEAKAPDDVLCYVDRLGALAVHWNEPPKGSPVGGVVIPVQHRVRLEPGLSFCPGPHWQHVKTSPGWVDRQRLGALRAVAGQAGDLMAEWARAKPAALVGMLAKTFHVPVLERLREMEASLPNPRLDVAQEIDARLAEMGEKVGRHQQQRRSQRRVHRSKVLG